VRNGTTSPTTCRPASAAQHRPKRVGADRNTDICTTTSPLAGEHRGVDAVLGCFGRTMELTTGAFRAELHDLVVDDEHSVSLHLATGERGTNA
jgi:hypothetical protein